MAAKPYLKANFQGPGEYFHIHIWACLPSLLDHLDFHIWDFFGYVHVHGHTHARTLLFLHLRDPG